jgi:hypothetical protein
MSCMSPKQRGLAGGGAFFEVTARPNFWSLAKEEIPAKPHVKLQNRNLFVCSSLQNKFFTSPNEQKV